MPVSKEIRFKNYPREHQSWVEMRRRCRSSSKHKDAKRYAKKGIAVCKRWENSFANFVADMGRRPVGTTLDRINNLGNYTPSNCRWATPKQQGNNRSTNIILTLGGRSLTKSEWCDLIGMNDDTLYRRLTTLGWTVEEALCIKVRRRKNRK